MVGTENAIRDEMEHIISRWSEKMKYFEIQLKEINENLKILNRTSSHKKTEVNKENNAEAFKDRINEIKPEIVKLWAKLDTMEDRLGFS
jgi:chromosome segregation ATPase